MDNLKQLSSVTVSWPMTQIVTPRSTRVCCQYDVMIWKCFPYYCSFERGVYRSLVDSPHRGSVMRRFDFSLVWKKYSTNNVTFKETARPLVTWLDLFQGVQLKPVWKPSQMSRSWRNVYMGCIATCRLKRLDIPIASSLLNKYKA